MIKERHLHPRSGFSILALLILLSLGTLFGAIINLDPRPQFGVPLLIVFILSLVGYHGLTVVRPNEAKVLTFFGTYIGTIRDAGFYYVNPFTSGAAVSLRVRNFETAKLKVNDADSNPIEIGAIVVWRVVDSAEAIFEVDDFSAYVHTQSESALRQLAVHHPYDAHGAGTRSLTTHQDEIAEELLGAVRQRLEKAGVEVIEARISHLAYSPEIAAAMLQRQQAGAVVAARQKIVEGAVGMVEQALAMLKAGNIVELDAERKAAMVSNLLVVLCSDRAATPVVNTGSLYT